MFKKALHVWRKTGYKLRGKPGKLVSEVIVRREVLIQCIQYSGCNHEGALWPKRKITVSISLKLCVLTVSRKMIQVANIQSQQNIVKFSKNSLGSLSLLILLVPTECFIINWLTCASKSKKDMNFQTNFKIIIYFSTKITSVNILLYTFLFLFGKKCGLGVFSKKCHKPKHVPCLRGATESPWVE